MTRPKRRICSTATPWVRSGRMVRVSTISLTLNLGVLNLFDSDEQQYGLIGEELFKPENQFGSDTSSLQQGDEEFGLPLRQVWLTMTTKI